MEVEAQASDHLGRVPSFLYCPCPSVLQVPLVPPLAHLVPLVHPWDHQVPLVHLVPLVPWVHQDPLVHPDPLVHLDPLVLPCPSFRQFHQSSLIFQHKTAVAFFAIHVELEGMLVLLDLPGHTVQVPLDHQDPLDPYLWGPSWVHLDP